MTGNLARWRTLSAASALLSATFLGLQGPLPAGAATTINVNVSDDSPGDVCPATCSLRKAIVQADADTGDTINLPANTYTLGQGQLVVSSSMTIVGAGAATTIIDGASKSRVLQVTAAGNLTMSGVTVQHGAFTATGGNPAGGGIEVLGTLALTASTVANNTVAITNAPGGSPAGAGIAGDSATSSITLTNVIIDNNKGSSTRIALIGGGVGASGKLAFHGGVVSNNVASFNPGDGLGEGGGIAIAGAIPATLDFLDIHDNTAGGGGGVVDEDGPATLSNSTLRNNHALSTNDDGGGWLANGRPDTLINVTISGNDSVRGGGGFTDFAGGSQLSNDTIADNTASAASGGIESGASPAVQVMASIVSNNKPGNCGIIQGGAIASAGSNIDSGVTCNFAAARDKMSTNPQLAPLASNGGPAPTYAIGSSSPAFDADFAVCPPPATDERGVARPQGLRCDIGAYEAPVATQTPPPPAPPSLPRAGHVAAPDRPGQTVAVIVVTLAALLAAMMMGLRRPARVAPSD